MKKFLPFRVNINGTILDGQYKNYKIIKVITNEIIDWNKYILLYVSLIGKGFNPCVNEYNFLWFLHTQNYINILNIKNIIIQKNNDIRKYKIEYQNVPIYNWKSVDDISYNIIHRSNHFYFESFMINTNYKQLKIEIDRLIKNRDKYNSIHFHLDKNGGGDIVPAHIILRCLIGEKEQWMKNIKKILKNGNMEEWDCWKEEDEFNDGIFEKLNLDHYPNYDTKYNGKIYLYMNNYNGSAAWFFITYLIYGDSIKFGSIDKSSQLVLIGHSGTTSGDGNSISIKYNNININCPTEQFISCSIKKYDWNRFWIE